MTSPDSGFNLELSRRKLLAAAGIAGGAMIVAPLIGAGEAAAAPSSPPSPDPVATPPVAGLHLQFGADASSRDGGVLAQHCSRFAIPVSCSGVSTASSSRPSTAETASYTDAKSGQVVYAYHAKLGRLRADTPYLYGALHDGAEPEFGTFRTAPRGRAPFTFTSFGDQGTPTLGKTYLPPPAGVTLAEDRSM